MQEDLEKGTTLKSLHVLDWSGIDLAAGKSQSTVLSKVHGTEREREKRGRKRQKMLSASAFWHLIRTGKVGDSQLLPQVVYADVKGLPDAPCLPNSGMRGHFPQGAFQSEYINNALPTWLLAGFVT